MNSIHNGKFFERKGGGRLDRKNLREYDSVTEIEVIWSTIMRLNQGFQTLSVFK